MLNPNTQTSTFDSPLDMLHACHDRIMDQCTTLQKIIQHLPMHGCDEQAQQAAKAVLRYFDTAGQLHHQDEEEDLFPLLRTSGNSEATSLITQLEAEHQKMDALWSSLREQLLLMTEQQSAALDRKLVADFTLAYGKHVMLENMKLLPLAARVLTIEQLQPMSTNMAKRRNVAPA